MRARVRLTRLERKQANAARLLAENLRATYMDGEPTFVTVVLNSDGFGDLIERFEYLRRDLAPQRVGARRHARRARARSKGQTADAQEAARRPTPRSPARRPPTATRPT